ncbi:putative acetyltransferase [Sphingomonas insulae]|uniref:GNAT family N-acetyltransferase n=1 Tax=Sphingomonas insulae TaxID=424800 RepID=A0ABN1HLG3_9SPHN|nr:GNAT family N-acetyltransferase [Sphingomonas insulae]NIJ30262.1 putative acetyltransferase [Sphingomonas insulae]
MQIRRDDPAAPHVADLLAHHLGELRGHMAEFAFALDATGLSAADVTFWTAWRDEALVGFVALKRLDTGHGELKSMRAAPAARGTGVGRALLHHVIAEARRRGYDRLSLETGTADLHAPAVALYRSAGFIDTGPFADYRPSPHNQFLTLPFREPRCLVSS